MAYRNYRELAANETPGVDYRLSSHVTHPEITVIAPHGGGIEPGSSELCEGIAGLNHPNGDYNCYLFEGIKPSGNRALHITSTRFDEPIALQLVGQSTTVVAVHGYEGLEPICYVGGLDVPLRDRIMDNLRTLGFDTRLAPPEIDGTHPKNIVNRSRSGKGVQLELTYALRSSLFDRFSGIRRRQSQNDRFYAFVNGVRTALAE